MKTLSLLLLAVLAGPASVRQPAQPPGADDGFAVHEWGTFNQLQGIAGVALEGMQHEDEPLPDFVKRRLARTPSPYRAYGDDSVLVHARHANTKMETPVLYFHSQIARRVRVEVTYEHGLLSEWYPAVAHMTPEGPLTNPDIQALPRSSIAWDVEVAAPSSGRDDDRRLPAVNAREPWALARDVDANVVTSGGESEKYLFYRGIGDQHLPLSVIPSGDVRVIVNQGDRIAGAVLIEMGERDGRFTVLGALDRGARVVDLAGAGGAGNRTASGQPKAEAVRDLGVAVEELLVAQGLYRDEARAMVKTWTRTWFDKPGRRVLYIVPSAFVNATLPLHIEPAPASLVRVLVGRLEYQTDDDRAQLAVAVGTDDKATLAARGRFLEPELRDVLQRGYDGDIRTKITALLRSLEGR